MINFELFTGVAIAMTFTKKLSDEKPSEICEHCFCVRKLRINKTRNNDS